MAVEVTEEGYLIYKDATFFRECVAEYAGCELDPDGSVWGLDAHKLYKVYRPLSEITKPSFLKTLHAKPLIDDHTIIGNGNGMVKPEDKNCGGVLTNVKVVGNELRGQIDVWSTKLINKIRSGKRELSLAYGATFKKQKGVFQGECYDFVQSDLSAGNHLALVDEARNGHNCRVVDCAYVCDSKIQLEQETMKWDTLSADELIAGLKSCSDECKAKAKEFLNTPTEDELKKAEEEKKAAEEKAAADAEAEKAKIEAEKEEAVDTAVAEAEKKAEDEAKVAAEKAEEDKKVACDNARKEALDEFRKAVKLAEDCRARYGQISLDGISTEKELAVKICKLEPSSDYLKTIAADSAVVALRASLSSVEQPKKTVTDNAPTKKMSFKDYMSAK